MRIATRGRFRVVCHVEREAYATAALVARMADQAMDRAPVWDDLTTFDGRQWRGLVDCITAGIPCQPYSLAGSRKGHEDERALWPELVRIVEECEPAFVFIENVPQFLKHFEPVWSCLSGVGFRFAPPLLQTAAERGAPHLRERVFILAAHADRAGLALGSWRAERCGTLRDEGSAATARDSEPANAHGSGLQAEWRGWVFDRERQTLRHDADGCGPGCRICGSHWETESPPVRMADGLPERVDQFRATGNAVIPAMAAAAWAYLMNTQAMAWISTAEPRLQPGRKSA